MRVTVVSETAALELSSTTPVIPPRVCWACAYGVRANAIQRVAEGNDTRRLSFFNIRDLSRANRASEGCVCSVRVTPGPVFQSAKRFNDAIPNSSGRETHCRDDPDQLFRFCGSPLLERLGQGVRINQSGLSNDSPPYR